MPVEETKRDLTNHPAYDGEPDWSPDGTKIAFVSDRNGDRGSQIYVMDADGKNPISLTDGPGRIRGIQTGLPMGLKIAYNAGDDWENHIAVMDADGR